MKRIVNNRPILFFALALILGLFCAGKCLNFAGARVLFLGLSLIAAGLLILFNKQRFLYVCTAFTLGVLLFSGAYGIYVSKPVDKKDVEITATIASEICEGDGFYYFDAEYVTADGEELPKKATVMTYVLPEERAGEQIKIIGDIESLPFELDGYFLSSYKKGKYYRIFADSVEGGGAGELKYDTRLKIKLKRALYETVDTDTADITVAMLFGDKYGIDEALYDNVKSSGLAHVFAVSGLHVGILAALFIFLAKRLKLTGVKKFVFVLAFLISYGAFCGFPSSVVRAIIMTAAFLLADCTGRQRDNLNCLSLAAIAVLLIFPTELFAPGFQMSFLAILGLIVLSQPIEKRLKFLPKKLAQIIAGSVAVNVMIYPVLAGVFGSLQTLFILSNIIILPIIPFIFTISLIICAFVLIIPAAAPVLVVQVVTVWPIKLVSATIGSLAISSVPSSGLGLAAVAFYFLIILLSRFVFLNKKIKLRTAAIVVTVTLSLAVLQFASGLNILYL